jgi:hypothetical protein
MAMIFMLGIGVALIGAVPILKAGTNSSGNASCIYKKNFQTGKVSIKLLFTLQHLRKLNGAQA